MRQIYTNIHKITQIYPNHAHSCTACLQLYYLHHADWCSWRALEILEFCIVLDIASPFAEPSIGLQELQTAWDIQNHPDVQKFRRSCWNRGKIEFPDLKRLCFDEVTILHISQTSQNHQETGKYWQVNAHICKLRKLQTSENLSSVGCSKIWTGVDRARCMFAVKLVGFFLQSSALQNLQISPISPKL